MRNGGIGRGWYEDYYPDEKPDEVKVLAEKLLKETLHEVFSKMSENHKKGIVTGVNGPRYIR